MSWNYWAGLRSRPYPFCGNMEWIGLAMKGVIVLDIEYRQPAEKALNHIFVGNQLDGVKFGPGPGSLLICFENYSNHSPDQLWLNIESKWAVFPKETRVFPTSEADMIELSEEEEYKFIFELRREKVIAVKLGSLSPHLHIEFESG
ncbi:hypothetical protein D3C73_806260 [compost metagenome]